MSVLIKGMEMPENCCDCPLLYEEVCDCRITGRHLDFEEAISKERPKDCPLIEVPPHGRLIEEEPIIKYITDGLNSGKFGYDAIEVLAEIKYAPTIIEAEDGT